MAAHGAREAMAVAVQGDLDNYFHDMDHLLAAERPAPFSNDGVCSNCGGVEFEYSGSGDAHVGSRVCAHCGVVCPGYVFWETMYGNAIPRKSSNYKRIHHFHERISQLLLQESEIPRDRMLQIAERLCDGTYSSINKESVRAVLRSLNMQIYIEKWLQIIFRITGVMPPCPGAQLLSSLDADFIDLQRPFNVSRVEGRKNFLNYNYVLARLFQKAGCPQFSMFFPLIKSKVKLQALDDMWVDMVRQLNWPATELQIVAPFAVQLEQPALALQRLASEAGAPIPVAIQIEPDQRRLLRWDRQSQEACSKPSRPHRSDPLAPQLQRLGVAKRRLR